MGGQIQWTVSLVMIALFTVAVIGFAINFANDTNAPVDISNDNELSVLYSNSSDNLSSFGSQSSDTYTSILNTTIPVGSQTAQSSGSVAITSSNVVGVTKNILQVGYQKIFGQGDDFGIFLTTFLALLVFITGMYIWKTLIGRSPD